MGGWAAGADRQARPSSGPHPKDRNEVQDPARAGLRPDRAELEGSDTHPAQAGLATNNPRGSADGYCNLIAPFSDPVRLGFLKSRTE
jgi:hypothetical protein